jgi:hypothetical protein
MKAYFMNKKIVLATASILLMLSLIATASASLSVGVKAGDWIQYHVTFTGTPSPDHSVTDAKMEVLDVQGTIIKVNILSTLSNGTQLSTNSTLNLETGQLIDNFIIPANLAAGDKFLDSNVGNVTISNVEQRTYAGATRTVDTATSGNNTYVWDQATGISVEGNSQGADYTMRSLATATNIWQVQNQILGFDPTTFYLIIVAIIAIVVIIIAAVAISMMRRKK